LSGIKEVETELAIEPQHDECRGQWRLSKHDGESECQLPPHENRHAVDRHPRCSKLEDRHDEVNRTGCGRESEEDEPKNVEVDVHPGRELAVCQRHVIKPPVVGRPPDQKARVHEDARPKKDPVSECIESGESHVACPDHQRDKVVAEAREHRDDEEEHHRGSVHREHLVVGLWINDLEVGVGELSANDEGLNTSEDEKHHPCIEVLEPELLVIDRVQPGD
jgi:hypothetical protein